MSSGRAFSNRLSAMSEQQALIEAKREAILKKVEERRKAQEDIQQRSGRYGQGSERDKRERGSHLLRQWGLKGKSKETSTTPSSSTSGGESAASPSSGNRHNSGAQNQFSNDGSFLEKFKKLQNEKGTKGEVKNESTVTSQLQTKSEEYGSKHNETEWKLHRQQQKHPMKEEQGEDESKEWFQSAVERAKRIAQSLAPSNSLEMKKSGVEPTSSSSAGIKLEEVCSTANNTGMALMPSLPTVADELASLVAVNGDHVENLVRDQNKAEVELMFLQEPESELYQSYRAKVESLRRGMVSEQNENNKRGKRSRWGGDCSKASSSPSASTPNRDPQLVRYALQVFGSSDLEEHQWKQCEEQMKMKLVYQDMMEAKAKKEAMERSGKRQYEYDSDEDVEGGTWEHKARKLEMEKTASKAQQLTHQATGKHHIGDFLPPSELTKFLAKYEALKNGETIVENDYEESKLNSSNLGFKMLQKMGWSEGAGLGSTSQGIINPINQGNQSSEKKGLGVEKPHELEEQDDEFEAYRKRMMLAYRFRPNPLNNPRRPYY